MRISANGNVGIGTDTPGSSLDVKGALRLSGASSGYVGFAVPSAAGSATYTWPSAAPASNMILQSTSAGVLSWVSAASGTGDALVANPLSQFAATTSAQLAGVLSDETGSGPGVFATSPTIATPIFTTNITAPLIIGGTGTTSTLTYKTTTGVGTTGADHIFQVGNNGATEAMRILNSGNVGIGTPTPAAKLVVATGQTFMGTNSDDLGFGAGPAFISRASGTASGKEYLGTMYKNNATKTGLIFSSSNSAAYIQSTWGSSANVDLILGGINSAGTYQDTMTLTSGGNVGIGTPSPGSALDVKGTLRLSGATSGYVGFAVPSAAGSATYTWPSAAPASNMILQSDNSGGLSWVTAATGTGDALVANPLSQFAATSSAQLAGVLSDETGTGPAVFATSPTIATPIFTTNITAPMIIGGTGTTSTLTYKTTSGVGTTGADHIFQVGNNGATEAMRILNSGNVGIGTGSPATRLHVNGSAENSSLVRFQSVITNDINYFDTDFYTSGTGGFSDGTRASLRTYVVQNGGALGILTKTSAGSLTEKVRVDSAGNVGIGTSSPGSTLDVKGTLRLSGATSGYVGFAVPSAAGSATYTWPSAAPASNKILQSDNTGALSWVTAATGTGDALTSNPLSQFAATTSAQLAGVISDETGSGAAVFGTSPTFTTNITAPMIIGGTGTTSTLTYKTTSGVGAAGADHIFQVGNNGATEAMRILNSGNVGIGTATPDYALSLYGASTSGINFGAATIAHGITGFSEKTTTGAVFKTTSTGGAQVTGIGSNTSTAGIYLNGILGSASPTAGTGAITLEATKKSGVNIQPLSAGDTVFTVRNASTPLFQILGSGNIGIGTTAPASALHIATAPTASANYGLVSLGSGAFDGSTAGYYGTGSTSSAQGTVLAANAASGYTGDLLNFQIAGDSKFRVDKDGNISADGTVTATSFSGSFSGTATTATNIAGGAAGSLPYQSGSATTTMLAIGSAGKILRSSGTAPAWSTATYPDTTTINQILFSSAANTVSGITTANSGVLVTTNAGVPGFTASGTTGTVLKGVTSGTPTFGAVSLTADVSGILPVANGGTGSSSQNFVDLTTGQSVGGAKTFTSDLTMSGAGIEIVNTLGSASLPSYTFSGDPNTGMYSGGADSLDFSTAGTQRLTIGSTGMITIGSPTPEAKMHVYGGGYSSSIDGSVYTYRNVHTYQYGGAQTGTMKIALPVSWSNTMIHFKITGYDYTGGAGGAWQVSVGGYLGASSWTSTSAEITGSAPFTSVRLAHDGTKAVLLLGTTATSWSYPQMNVSEVTTSYASQWGYGTGWATSILASETGIASINSPTVKTTVKGDMYVSGSNYSTAYYYTSDRRLKENIQELEHPLDKILALRGVQFDWKRDKRHEIGLIAQEVEEVYPDLVATDKSTGLKSVKYGNLVAPLIESTKELYGMCKMNEHQIKTIETQMAKLEKRQDKVERKMASIEEDLAAKDALIKKQQEQIDFLIKEMQQLKKKK